MINCPYRSCFFTVVFWMCLGVRSLTYEEDEHAPQYRALVLGALWLVPQVDARHGHENQSHCRETQDGTGDHQRPRRLDVCCRHMDSQRNVVISYFKEHIRTYQIPVYINPSIDTMLGRLRYLPTNNVYIHPCICRMEHNISFGSTCKTISV